MLGKIRNGSDATRQAIQFGGNVGLNAAHVQAKMLDNTMQIGVLVLQHLMKPMNQFNVGVSTQLAENGGRLGSAEQLGVKLAEQVRSVDFSHGSEWAEAGC